MIPGVLGMQNVLNGVSMAEGVMEMAQGRLRKGRVEYEVFKVVND